MEKLLLFLFFMYVMNISNSGLNQDIEMGYCLKGVYELKSNLVVMSVIMSSNVW